MNATPDRTGDDDYRPPTIEDIDSSEDREFAVIPGFEGSETDRN